MQGRLLNFFFFYYNFYLYKFGEGNAALFFFFFLGHRPLFLFDSGTATGSCCFKRQAGSRYNGKACVLIGLFLVAPVLPCFIISRFYLLSFLLFAFLYILKRDGGQDGMKSNYYKYIVYNVTGTCCHLFDRPLAFHVFSHFSVDTKCG
jgi:hypothetical protein